MKLLWEEQEPNGNTDYGRARLVALLVDANKEDGVLTETVIAKLGTIETRFLTVNIRATREFHQGLFWSKVDNKLNRIKLSPEEKDRIESRIAEKVPRPSNEWALWGVTCIPHFDT